MKNGTLSDVWIEALLKPENELEKTILKDSSFRKGLLWGKPRFGHPEGKIVYHIREVLDNIDKLSISSEQRIQLRIIAFVHDTFKCSEDKSGNPRDWSKHHAVYARKFLEKYINDPAILIVTALHDEAYYSWRQIHLYGKAELGKNQLEKLFVDLGESIQLYYLFFKCDTQTGDKNQAPLKWFEKTVKLIEIVEF